MAVQHITKQPWSSLLQQLAAAIVGMHVHAKIIHHAWFAQIQDTDGLVIGAEVKDNLSGKKMHVYAKQVINATGPFADSLRQMSDPSKPSIIMPSAGMLVAHLWSCCAPQSTLSTNPESCITLAVLVCRGACDVARLLQPRASGHDCAQDQGWQGCFHATMAGCYHRRHHRSCLLPCIPCTTLWAQSVAILLHQYC